MAHDRTVVGFDRAGDPMPPIEAECVCVDLTTDTSDVVPVTDCSVPNLDEKA